VDQPLASTVESSHPLAEQGSKSPDRAPARWARRPYLARFAISCGAGARFQHSAHGLRIITMAPGWLDLVSMDAVSSPTWPSAGLRESSRCRDCTSARRRRLSLFPAGMVRLAARHAFAKTSASSCSRPPARPATPLSAERLNRAFRRNRASTTREISPGARAERLESFRSPRLNGSPRAGETGRQTREQVTYRSRDRYRSSVPSRPSPARVHECVAPAVCSLIPLGQEAGRSRALPPPASACLDQPVDVVVGA